LKDYKSVILWMNVFFHYDKSLIFWACKITFFLVKNNNAAKKLL